MNTYKICVRYVNENIKVIERFLGFVGTSSTTAETLANHLVKFMDELGLDWQITRKKTRKNHQEDNESASSKKNEAVQ